ncbi:4-(cytidine 5'-diphospho)-2-C-methyl-D-erythritol kinase [Kangiella geojedonensis]|uniref:4-diphosphocytidyl-2-C-methyl-D-erythritol kinase n=1 Tax=Kangiella geojedonensis TaxID=914150 RepID=A0A0F6RD88_9GAMM|nr:4-(cytidine 5'-diphospho)-2-C-methyl-D-erythritol kinase [Kangiella geojedonensis]AKE52701.1 4-diphosphocytidyl-2-C-methyl-D-erythritol kinase [Kangiella geojedonensis]
MTFAHSTGYTNPQGYSYWPAPAKLNLELRILGRRDDGYHDLQTLFQLLDCGDDIWIKPNDSGQVTLQSEYDEVPSDDNLIIKAARALEPFKGKHQGADIRLNKKLPSGAGLGGGSSDAATTLVALNQLWDIKLPNEKLCELGKSLGADVPVFVKGKTAWAEGIGEILTETEVPEKWYLIVYPDVKINTSIIFSHPALTRDNKPIKLRASRTEASLELGYNAFEPLVAKLYPEVREALEFLSKFGKATLTGTGSCVFLTFDKEREVRKIAALCKQRWLTLTARGINTSPLI